MNHSVSYYTCYAIKIAFSDNADGDVELEEEEVHETPKNFKNGGRFKTNMTNPKVNDLTTIEEKNEDLRSAASSRSASRPASVMSDKSFSSQFEFQSGGG